MKGKHRARKISEQSKEGCCDASRDLQRGVRHGNGGANHDIISENIVNATTPGYRRQGLLYESSAASFAPSGSVTPAAEPPVAPSPPSYQYFEPGAIQQTGNPLDVAVHGNAFFVVQGPNGPLYTRNGAFERGAARGTPDTRRKISRRRRHASQ